MNMGTTPLPPLCDENKCPYYELIHALHGRLMLLESRVAAMDEKISADAIRLANPFRVDARREGKKDL